MIGFKMSRLLGMSAIGLTLALTACSKKNVKPDELTGPTDNADESPGLGDSDSGHAMGLQTINFPYDSFMLDETAKNTLKSNATLLKDHSKVQIQIEGHCDQRGGIQYNIALGEKRANAVKNYMADKGISKDRMSIVSFGKERPIDPAENEQAYAKNRRANFVITSK